MEPTTTGNELPGRVQLSMGSGDEECLLNRSLVAINRLHCTSSHGKVNHFSVEQSKVVDEWFV